MFRLGKCTVVTARLYAVVAGILVAAMSCYYVYLRPSFGIHEAPLTHHNLESSRIAAQWSDYLVDCGGEKVIENSVHTKILWNDKYENNVVAWSGYFADAILRKKGIFIPETELNILVKMDPSESTVFADLVLTVNSALYSANKPMFDGLKKGAGINFTATVAGLGSEFKMHHLNAIEVAPSGTFKVLNDILVRESALP